MQDTVVKFSVSRQLIAPHAIGIRFLIPFSRVVFKSSWKIIINLFCVQWLNIMLTSVTKFSSFVQYKCIIISVNVSLYSLSVTPFTSRLSSTNELVNLSFTLAITSQLQILARIKSCLISSTFVGFRWSIHSMGAKLKCGSCLKTK